MCIEVRSANMQNMADPNNECKPISNAQPPLHQQGGAQGSASAASGGANAACAAALPLGFGCKRAAKQRRERGWSSDFHQDGKYVLALPAFTVVACRLGSGSTPPTGMDNPVLPSQADAKNPNIWHSGSRKKQKMAAAGCEETGFTPQLITVSRGEDVYSKIMSFVQRRYGAVCILSGNGVLSQATLFMPAAKSGGVITLEGKYEIVSLSGLFVLSKNGGQRCRTGGFSVMLAGPDGRIIGGAVAGLLTAACDVQVVVSSFIP